MSSVENKISKSIHPLLIVLIGITVLSTLGLLGIVFFGERVLQISLMVFIPIVVIGAIAGQVANIRDRKSINQNWQNFAESHGLDYEINKDARRLNGKYRGYMVSGNTTNIGIRGIELRTSITLHDLRVSQDTYIKFSSHNDLDKFRKWFEQPDRAAKGEFEQHFKIIAQPEYFTYLSVINYLKNRIRLHFYRYGRSRNPKRTSR